MTKRVADLNFAHIFTYKRIWRTRKLSGHVCQGFNNKFIFLVCLLPVCTNAEAADAVSRNFNI